MPKNPGRAAQGGDVDGTKPIDITYSVGDAIQVANASYDPGYDFGATMDFESKADLLRGFCDYGRPIGDPGSALAEWDTHYKAPSRVTNGSPEVKKS